MGSGFVVFAQPYSISTIAGGAPPLTPLAALNAAIGQPQRTTIDAAGNLYFSSSNAVYKMDTTGVLTLIAGNSRLGFSGDGGPATSAQLNLPKGVAIDASGNVYIADSGNNRVRQVAPNGIITTLAGNGTPGYSGDGGVASSAQLHLPSGVAVDSSGNVYIADTANFVIRQVNQYGIINTVAGNGTLGFSGDGGSPTIAQLSGAEDVAVDANGNMFIADTGNACIREASPNTGVMSTVAGTGGSPGYSGDGGAATKATMNQPFSLAMDGSGNLYIAEYGDSRIRKVTAKGIISTIAGTGSPGFAGDGGQASKAQLNLPAGISIDAGGNLYIADSANLRVREISSSGNIATIAGNGIFSYSGDGGLGTKAQLNGPAGVAIDAAGNVYISDTVNNRVRKVSPNGIIATIAGTGSPGFSGDGGAAANAQINSPQGLAVDAAGNLYIADSGNNCVRMIAPDGTITTFAGNATPGFSGDGGPAASAEMTKPFGLAVDTAGNLYIAAFGNSRIRKVSAGIITTVAGNGFTGYSGDGGPAISAAINGPKGVAVDSGGNIYIADTANNRIRRVTPDGNIATIAGTGVAGFSGDGGQSNNAELVVPASVAVDSAGNLYILDGSARLRKVIPNGIINTVAGTGTQGYSGDGGPAISAQFNNPAQIALDAAGNLYVADAGNNAIRAIDPSSSGLAISAVTNGASNQPGPVAPGEVVVLYGSGLGPAKLAQFQLGSDGRVDSALAGTQVFFNGAAAPVLYASATQTAVIVPYEITGTQAQVIALYQGQTSPPVTVTVASSAPALFTLDSSGQGQAAAINQDGSINSAAHPAAAGSYVTLYETGEGQTSPSGVDGLPASSSLPTPVLPVSVEIGGQTATIQYAGAAPGLVAGVMQINAQIPSGLPAGPVPVTAQVGIGSSQAGVTIAVSGN